MPILAIDSIIGASPTPTVQLLLDGIQEMLARNNSVLRHLVSALTRVLIKVDFLTVDDLGVGTAGLQVLLRLEDGRQESRLLLGLLLLLLLLELFSFPLLGATLLLTIVDLILHLLDVVLDDLGLVLILETERFIFNDRVLNLLLGLLAHLLSLSFFRSHVC